MDNSRNNRADADVPPTKDDEENDPGKSSQPMADYYYDDSTGYEIYDEQDDNDAQDSSMTDNSSSCRR